MGEVAVIAGPLLEHDCHIDLLVRLKPKSAVDTEPTVYRSVVLPEGNLITENNDLICTVYPPKLYTFPTYNLAKKPSHSL